MEDLHWADADTVAVLEYLVGRVAELPIVIVAAARDDEPGSAAGRLAAAAGITRLPVARLAPAEVAELITSRAGQLPPPQVAELVAQANGLPLLAEELADVSAGAERARSAARRAADVRRDRRPPARGRPTAVAAHPRRRRACRDRS